MKNMLGVMITLATVFTFSASANADVCSTFDVDEDGWTCNTPAQCSWDPSGGNPNGYLRFDDDSSADTHAIAPAKFLGDWSSLDGVGYLSYDHKILSIGIVNTWNPYRIYISGSGGSAEWIGDIPSDVTDWLPQQAFLRESDWDMLSGTWEGLLASVENLQIRIEQSDGTDQTGIDNMCISEPQGWQTPGPAEASVYAKGSARVSEICNHLITLLLSAGMIFLLRIVCGRK